MRRLLRAWESQYLPQRTGELRLTSARKFREHAEDDGIGDTQEGEQRHLHEGTVTLDWQDPEGLPAGLRDMEIDLQLGFRPKPVTLKGVKSGTTPFLQEVRVGDSGVPSPYLLCFSHHPTCEAEWRQLEQSLPPSKDTWTCVTDLAQLMFEIKCGIYRWLKLGGASSYKIETFDGPVQYPYDDAPTPKNPEELLQRDELLFGRWLRKRQRFQHQREYRFGFYLSSPEIPTLPDYIDIELTRTGIGLFQGWEPSELWVP